MRNLLWLLAGIAGVALLYLALSLGTPKPRLTEAKPSPAAPPVAAARPDAPNVVFILVDTLRTDRFLGERNGQPVMPKLRALAAEGRNFTRAISPSSHTRTTVASLITGQYVDTHGVYYGAMTSSTGASTAQVVPEGWTTLAETLAAAGYTPWAFVTNGNAHASAGYAQGFPPENYVYEASAIAERVTQAALDRVQGLKQPFYLYLHYLDPHAPYFPPARYQEVFGPLPELSASDRATLAEDRQIPYLMVHDDLLFGRKAAEAMTPLTEAGRETMRIWYDAECRYIDDEVARLIEGLRKEHPNTLFVFTSDHGEEFWEHGGMGHGFTLYQEQIRVPLFLLGPGVAPESLEVTTGNIGLFRTLVDYLKIATSATPQGDNLLGADFPARAFTRTKGPSTELAVDLEAVVEGTDKGIRDAAAGRLDAFDLLTDPGELFPSADLVRTRPLAGALDAHDEANRIARPARIAPESIPTDPALREHLINIGYK